MLIFYNEIQIYQKYLALSFFDKTFTEDPLRNDWKYIKSQKKLQLRFVLKNKNLKSKVRNINLKLILVYQLK